MVNSNSYFGFTIEAATSVPFLNIESLGISGQVKLVDVHPTLTSKMRIAG